MLTREPNNTFFIGDLHFDDNDIMGFANRPFEDVTLMNECIINHWNETIKDTDTVFILGDIGNIEYLKKLKGYKIIILGNHDNIYGIRDPKLCEEYKIVSQYNIPIIINDFFILSHEPMYINRTMPYMNIFAHVHYSPLYKDYSRWHYIVSAERIGYKPISLKQIIDKTILLEDD